MINENEFTFYDFVKRHNEVPIYGTQENFSLGKKQSTIFTRKNGNEKRALSLSAREFDDLADKFSPLFVAGLNEHFKKAYYKNFEVNHAREIEALKNIKDLSPKSRLLFTSVFSKIGQKRLFPYVSKNFDKTFFPDGLQEGNLYTISAPSGGGKTALAINITASLMIGFNPLYDLETREPSKVLYVSLEQSKEEIEARILSALSGIMNLKNAVTTIAILSNSIPENRIIAFETVLHIYDMFKDNVVIIDGEDLIDNSIYGVLDGIAEKCKNFNPDIMILDQIVNITSDNPECDDLSPLELKSFCQNRKVPLLAITQMSKDAIKSNKKHDIAHNSSSDLRGSSFLEHQSAEIIIFQLRQEPMDDGVLVDMKSMKSRYGKKAEVSMVFHGECNLFQDITEDNKSSDVNQRKGTLQL